MRIRYILAIAVAAAALLSWLTALAIAHSRLRVDQCPSCLSTRVRPSWPTAIDKFLSISAVAAFRCEACL